MKYLYLIILTFCSSSIYANDIFSAPEWVFDPPKNTETKSFYIGEADSEESTHMALSNAFENAINEAVLDNSDLSVEVEQEVESDNFRSKLRKRSKVKANIKNLVGFHKIDQFTYKKHDGVFSAKVLCSYNVMNKSNKGRHIANIESIKASIQSPKNKNDLIITSNPTGAKVFINGIYEGKTPYSSHKDFNANSIQIELDHPLYEKRTFNYQIKNNGINKIHKILLKASITFILKTIPENAKVFLNNEYLGQSPIYKKTTKTFELNKLRIEHEDTLPLIIDNIKVDKLYDYNHEFTLQRRMGNFIIDTNVIGSEVYLDNILIGKTPLVKTMTYDIHKIKIIPKNGYTSVNYKVKIDKSTPSRLYFKLKYEHLIEEEEE